MPALAPDGMPQQVVLGINPSNKYTAMAAVSSRAMLCGFDLELPSWVSDRMPRRRELKIAWELTKTYLLSATAIEDATFNHRDKRYGICFSQVGVGKNCRVSELDRIAPRNCLRAGRLRRGGRN